MRTSSRFQSRIYAKNTVISPARRCGSRKEGNVKSYVCRTTRRSKYRSKARACVPPYQLFYLCPGHRRKQPEHSRYVRIVNFNGNTPHVEHPTSEIRGRRRIESGSANKAGYVIHRLAALFRSAFSLSFPQKPKVGTACS